MIGTEEVEEAVKAFKAEVNTATEHTVRQLRSLRKPQGCQNSHDKLTRKRPSSATGSPRLYFWNVAKTLRRLWQPLAPISGAGELISTPFSRKFKFWYGVQIIHHRPTDNGHDFRGSKTGNPEDQAKRNI